MRAAVAAEVARVAGGHRALAVTLTLGRAGARARASAVPMGLALELTAAPAATLSVESAAVTGGARGEVRRALDVSRRSNDVGRRPNFGRITADRVGGAIGGGIGAVDAARRTRTHAVVVDDDASAATIAARSIIETQIDVTGHESCNRHQDHPRARLSHGAARDAEVTGDDGGPCSARRAARALGARLPCGKRATSSSKAAAAPSSSPRFSAATARRKSSF